MKGGGIMGGPGGKGAGAAGGRGPESGTDMPEPRSSWAGSAHPPVKAALIGRPQPGRRGQWGVAPLGGRGSGRSHRPAGSSTGPESPGPAPPPARRARPRPLAAGSGVRLLGAGHACSGF